MDSDGSKDSSLIVTAADFEAAKLSAFDFGVIADALDLRERIGLAQSQADVAQDQVRSRVFSLLSALVQIHFKPEVPSDPYGPMWVAGDKRSAVPSDFRGEQAQVLAQVAGTIRSPVIRARLADIAWINNKRDIRAAKAAIESYLEVASSLLSGDLESRFQKEAQVPHEFVSALQRAAAIWSAVKGDQALFEKLSGLAKSGEQRAGPAGELHSFLEIQRLSLRYGLNEPLKTASECTTLAEKLPESVDPIFVNALLNLAADAFELGRDSEQAVQARLAAAEQYVRMAERMAASAMAASSWLMDAIEALRRIKGTKSRRKELESRLREFQQDVFDEMGTISSGPIDLTDIAENRIKLFSELPLGEALGLLASLRQSPSPEQLRQEALDSAKDSPLAAMIGGSILDHGGKVISENPGAFGVGEPDREWFMHQYARREGIGRDLFVSGELEPVRRSLVNRLDFGVRHFGLLAAHSPFVPEGHELLFSSALSAFMHGYMVAAVYGLVPQLENSIRYVVKLAGEEASVIKSDMIQEDTNLSVMLHRHREALEMVFGENVVLEIELMFDHRAGPSLRHRVAHGKVSSNECSSSTCRYACWFIFRLMCMPLFPQWAQFAPLLDEFA